jgi:hypothetical protein
MASRFDPSTPMDAVRRTLPATQIMEGVDAMIFADEIDRLLAHMYSSPRFLSDFKLLPATVNVHLSRSLELRGLPLLFELQDERVHVLNEQMQLTAEEVQAFATSMFEAYPLVQRVVFPVLHSPGPVPLPNSQVKVTQDMVLTLPDNIEQYEQALGRATRSALKRSMNKLEREHQAMRLEVLQPGMDDARALALLDRILSLNHERMALRGHTSRVDEAEARAVRQAYLRCGMLVLLHNDHDLVAGTINLHFGGNSFLYLLAHDTRFNRYSPGMLCCYLSVLECIRQKQGEYHFLWGQYEYKYRLLANPREMVRLTVYRNARDCRDATFFGLASAWANLRYEWRNRLLLCAMGRADEGRLNRLLQSATSALKKARRRIVDMNWLRKDADRSALPQEKIHLDHAPP